MEPPADLDVAGRQLWQTVVAVYTLDPHERVLLGRAARLADRLSALDAAIRREGVMVGDKVNPAATEARLTDLALTRVLVSLRLPDGDDVRPQRRGPRGVYPGAGHGAASA